ncbi:MAG: hypothetical protein AB1758_19390 [Candidatus Eremiobacterota bacterium]
MLVQMGLYRPSFYAPTPLRASAAPARRLPEDTVTLEGGAPPPSLSRGAPLARRSRPAVPTTLCELDPSPATPGYRPEIVRVTPGDDHTIHDLEGYLRDNLGEETLVIARTGREPVLVAVGEGQETADRLVAAGWRMGDAVDKAVGFHRVNRAVSPEGVPSLVVWRVNGDDRVLHIQSLLKLAGLPADRLTTTGTTRSFQDDFLRTFRQHGKPDLVVYGMAKTAAAAILKEHPLRNAGYLLDVFRRRGAPKVEDDSRRDLSGLKMEVMKLASGQTVWFVPPLYGDLTRDVVDALVEHGAPVVHFLGTCGAPNPELRVGDIVTPSTLVTPDGKRESLSWLAPTKGARPGATCMRVSTPNIETRQWAEQAARDGVDFIEVELAYWLEALKNRPDIRFRVQAVVSDVLLGPNSRDMTRWSWQDGASSHGQIVESLQDALGIAEKSGLRVKSYEAVPLV